MITTNINEYRKFRNLLINQLGEVRFERESHRLDFYPNICNLENNPYTMARRVLGAREIFSDMEENKILLEKYPSGAPYNYLVSQVGGYKTDLALDFCLERTNLPPDHQLIVNILGWKNIPYFEALLAKVFLQMNSSRAKTSKATAINTVSWLEDCDASLCSL